MKYARIKNVLRITLNIRVNYNKSINIYKYTTI